MELIELIELIECVGGCIIAIILGIIGVYLIYRTFKPVCSKAEIERQDLQEIHQDWYGDGEPTEEFIYERTCEYEKSRNYSRMTFRITGAIFIIMGVMGIIELFK